jgi:hypothetical protein
MQKEVRAERGASLSGDRAMNILLTALLVPLHFTAPADVLGLDAKGASLLSSYPVHAYLFREVDASGATVVVPGYADSSGSAILAPHAPGARETVWLSPGPSGRAVTITMLSVDANGNLSAPSNPCVMGRGAPARRRSSSGRGSREDRRGCAAARTP